MGIPINLMLVVIAYFMYMIYLHVRTLIEAAQNEIEKTASMRVDGSMKKPEAKNAVDSRRVTKLQDHEKDGSPTEEDNDFHALEKDDDEDDETIRKIILQQDLPNMIVEEKEEEELAQKNQLSSSTKKVSFQAPHHQSQQQQSNTDQQESPVELTGALKESYDKLESRIQETAIQAYWYIGIYVMTHAWNMIWSICEQIGVTPPYWLLFLCSFFWPSQGFWNVFVFLRPRITALRKRYPDLSYCVAVYWSIFYLDDRTLKLRTAELPLASRARLSRLSLLSKGKDAAPALVNHHNNPCNDIKNSNTVERPVGKSTTSHSCDSSNH
jgi:hypothetical protein